MQALQCSRPLQREGSALQDCYALQERHAGAARHSRSSCCRLPAGPSTFASSTAAAWTSDSSPGMLQGPQFFYRQKPAIEKCLKRLLQGGLCNLEVICRPSLQTTSCEALGQLSHRRMPACLCRAQKQASLHPRWIAKQWRTASWTPCRMGHPSLPHRMRQRQVCVPH